MKWNYTIIASAATGIVTLCVVIAHTSYRFGVSQQPNFYTEEYSTNGGDYDTSPSDVKLEHWLPDWYNTTDTDLLLYVRLKGIRERCQSYSGVRNEWKSAPPIVMRRSRNIEYCATAKAGSTFWKQLLRVTKHRGTRSEKDSGAKIVCMDLKFCCLIMTS